jgi:hypothetical protein
MKTYLLDRPWLVHCLNSIRMFGEGFSGVTVLVPRAERIEFEKLTQAHGVRTTPPSPQVNLQTLLCIFLRVLLLLV